MDNFIYTLTGHPPTSELLTELGWISADETQLTAIELGLPRDSRNLLWVISEHSYNIAKSANITQGGTMQEYLIPGSSGELIIELTHSNGKNESSSLGYVRESYEYKLNFTAKGPGKYVQRFKVNGEYSNPITFNSKDRLLN